LLDSLLNKVKNKEETVCILGLGRVGLPLASVFATSGLKVIGIENNKERLESIKNKICPFFDPPLQENLVQAINSRNLSVEDDLLKVKNQADIIFVTVGTPKSSENTIDYSQLYSSLNVIKDVDLKDKMVIMRSTLPPKTTTEIVIPFLELKTSKKAGDDFGIAVCPERILEGKAVQELCELPEIVGGINKISNDIAKELFLTINPKKRYFVYISFRSRISKAIY